MSVYAIWYSVSNPNGRPLLFSRLLATALAPGVQLVSNPNGRPLLFSRHLPKTPPHSCAQFPTRTGDLCYLADMRENPPCRGMPVSNPNGRPLLFSPRSPRIRICSQQCFQPERATS